MFSIVQRTVVSLRCTALTMDRARATNAERGTCPEAEQGERFRTWGDKSLGADQQREWAR